VSDFGEREGFSKYNVLYITTTQYLDVPMHNTILVKVFQSQQQLFRIHSYYLHIK
jgi:hypothetical protein